MKKTRRFVALLLAAVLALALFTACGAAEQPQSAIGKVYEDWFVEQINSKRPADKPVQKVDVKHSDMMVALAKISEDGKFKARDGGDHEANGCGFGESWYWMILSDPIAWFYKPSQALCLPERAYFCIQPSQSAPDGRRRRLRGFSRDKNSVENHRLCPFSTPGFFPRRFVENCPG